MESFSAEASTFDIILALVDKIADTIEKIGYELIKLTYRIHIDQNNRQAFFGHTGLDADRRRTSCGYLK